MTIRLCPVALLGIGLALAAVPGCAPAFETSRPAADNTAVACASEAERLLRRVEVRAEPAVGSTVLEELEPGRFVYRCGRQGAWLAVMFPRPEEAVDCSTRPAGRTCPVGWVAGDLETEMFG